MTHRALPLLSVALLMIVACGDDPSPAVSPRDTPGPEPEVLPDPSPDDPAPDDDRPDPPPDAMPDPEPAIDPQPEPCPEPWREVLSEPLRIGVAEAFSVEIAPCMSASLLIVQPRETALAIVFQSLPWGARVDIRDALGEELASGWIEAESVTFDFVTLRSGEVWVTVVPPEGTRGFEVSGVLSCAEGCGREATRYPIVLFHGMAGTDSYFGVLEYYFGVPGFLQDQGYEVFTPVTQFIGPSEDRAARLTEQIDAILEETGAAKIHMIGHSQGGIDMRVLVSGLGYADRVASMTTVATPHGGVPIDLPQFLTGQDFSADYMLGEFVQTYPDVESIPRFSWAGRTCGLLERSCRDEMNGEVVSPFLIASYRLIQAAARDDDYEGANDGLITVTSSMWGEHLGILPTDHFDEVGQIADQREGPFDHLQFYLDEARRLRQLEIDLDL